jgi:hypothetical protein
MADKSYKFESGEWRDVHLIGDFAIKVPGNRCPEDQAMCLNRWEHEMCTVWRDRFKWEHLCPVVWCEPAGRILMMQRGTSDATHDEIDAIYDRYYPSVGCESKTKDWGHVEGKLVVFDYGFDCWTESAMEAQRRYYRDKAGPAIDIKQ